MSHNERLSKSPSSDSSSVASTSYEARRERFFCRLRKKQHLKR